MTIATRSDTRTVDLDLTGEHQTPIDCSHAGPQPGQLAPDRAEVVVDLLTGTVVRVGIIGPRLNRDGTSAALGRRTWLWPEGFGPDSQVWPPPNAPAVALAVVEHALTAVTR